LRPGAGGKPKPAVVWNDVPRWYCVRSQYASEALATAQIVKAGFEVFVPTELKPATRARRNAIGAIIPARPARVVGLFPRYQFVQFRRRDQWQKIRELPGVDCILGTAHDTPIPMPERAMEFLRGMCDADGRFHENGEAPNSLVGALVRMTEGPMTMFEGICDWSDGQRVRVLLALFGRPCPVTVDQAVVEMV
jgi:transcription antitermination factor NusG